MQARTQGGFRGFWKPPWDGLLIIHKRKLRKTHGKGPLRALFHWTSLTKCQPDVLYQYPLWEPLRHPYAPATNHKVAPATSRLIRTHPSSYFLKFYVFWCRHWSCIHMLRSVMNTNRHAARRFWHKFGFSIDQNAFGCIPMWRSRPVRCSFRVVLEYKHAGNYCKSGIFHRV